MLITECFERECCQDDDLVPVIGTVEFDRLPYYVMCIHCFKFRQLTRVTDLAGSGEWEYTDVKKWPHSELFDA